MQLCLQPREPHSVHTHTYTHTHARMVLGQVLQEAVAQDLQPDAWRPWVQALSNKAQGAVSTQLGFKSWVSCCYRDA